MKCRFFVAMCIAFSLCLPVAGHAKRERRHRTPAANKKTIHLVWMIDTNTSWEVSWIRELLSSVKEEMVEVHDFHGKTCLDNSICVTPLHADKGEHYERFFDRLHQNGCKFGIIHISDEAYSHSTSGYSKAQFVLRNYWHKKFAADPKVVAIPLGYKANFWAGRPDKKTKSVLQRRYNWSFAGQTNKSTRASMLENMGKVDRFFLHSIQTFSSPDSLPVDQYRNMLLDSIFAPCPRGYGNLDSFRICEALECGCIPIVERQPFDYFARLFMCDDSYLSAYPFLSVDSWDEIPEQINNVLLSDLEQLEQLRQQCNRWWIDYKNYLKEKIANIIHQTMGQ